MKKKSFILIVFLLICSLFCLTACQGEQGPVGEKGPQGDKGATGAQGAQGDKGATGAQGETGESGANANDFELSVTSEGIVWKHTNEEDWKPVINFEELFAYRYTYTVTLNANGGTLTDGTVLKDQVYKTELILPEPEFEPYNFLGWYDEDGEVIEDNYLVVLRSYNLTAKWNATVVLEGTEGAEGTPRLPYRGKEMSELVADIKELFLTDYCEAAGYDETMTAKVKAMTAKDLYNELLFGAGRPQGISMTHEGESATTPGLLYKINGSEITLTDLCVKYQWLFDWMLSRSSSLGTSDDTKAGFPKGNNNDSREMFLRGLLVNGEDTATNHFNELTIAADYPCRCLAMHLTNFFDMTGQCYAGTSYDKIVSFDPNMKFVYKVENGAVVATETPYDPFEGLVDTIRTEVNQLITLEVGETYELLTLVKDGYTFLGWFDGETPVTVLDATFCNKTITAKWEEVTE